MYLSNIRIRNFRKLNDVEFSLNEENTFLCGPNNSGKSSVIDVLNKFLNGDEPFSPYDIPLPKIEELKKIGDSWCSSKTEAPIDQDKEKARINAILPELILTFSYDKDAEISKVQRFIPNFEKNDGFFSIAYRLEIKDFDKLLSEFLKMHKSFEEIKKLKEGTVKNKAFATDLFNFLLLTNSISKFFSPKGYRINPENPEMLIEESASFLKESKELVRLQVIPAERGITGDEGKLSASLSDFLTHKFSDISALDKEELEAFYDLFISDQVVGLSMKNALSAPLRMLKKQLNYPNLDNPDIDVTIHADPGKTFSTSAEIRNSFAGQQETLPDSASGLGYQNLVHITLRLWRFIDEWLHPEEKEGEMPKIAPILLVLIEEPEAHLHPQVEQLFAQRLPLILKEEIVDKSLYNAQAIVTTHSDSLIRRADLRKIRYFHRDIPRPSSGTTGDETREAAKKQADIQIRDLSSLYNDKKDEVEFLQRYLVSTSHELFFADAAIMVEGSGENAVLPHFVESRKSTNLKESYYSIVPIYGSHFSPLFDFLAFLGLPTLIITDIDYANLQDGRLKKADKYSAGLFSMNAFLSQKLGDLTKDGEHSKDADSIVAKIGSANVNNNCAIVCETPEGRYHPTTLEDAVIAHNKAFFKNLTEKEVAESKTLKDIKKLCSDGVSDSTFEDDVRKEITKDSFKGDFAVDLLQLGRFGPEGEHEKLSAPNYIEIGLSQLEEMLERMKINAN